MAASGSAGNPARGENSPAGKTALPGRGPSGAGTLCSPTGENSPIGGIRAPLDASEAGVAGLLREILTVQRSILATLRRQVAPDPAALAAAIADELGGARFTTNGLLAIADEDRGAPLAVALADLIDMNASEHGRSTSLGRLLARLPELETIAASRGVRVFRLRACDAEAREARNLAR